MVEKRKKLNWDNPEWLKKVSGKNNWCYGKKKIEVMTAEGYKRFMKLNHSRKGTKLSKEHLKKCSEGLLRHYSDKDRKEKHIRSIMKGIIKRPTSFESRLIGLIKKYKLPYKYVGNGEFFINGKNPDFVNTNGQKTLIEVYHWYPARKNYEIERYNFFSKYDFRTAFLQDEHLFSDEWENMCIQVIMENEEARSE